MAKKTKEERRAAKAAKREARRAKLQERRAARLDAKTAKREARAQTRRVRAAERASMTDAERAARKAAKRVKREDKKRRKAAREAQILGGLGTLAGGLGQLGVDTSLLTQGLDIYSQLRTPPATTFPTMASGPTFDPVNVGESFGGGGDVAPVPEEGGFLASIPGPVKIAGGLGLAVVVGKALKVF